MVKNNKGYMKGSAGQTVVEYILLLAVVVAVIATVLRHPLIKDLTSEGDLIAKIATMLQFNYRHALPGKVIEKYPADYSAPNHSSYAGSDDTRFFGPKQGYK